MADYNIIYITVDSWNRNFVGFYNKGAGKEALTPYLDAYAKKCVSFLSAYSPSVKTKVSFLSLLSGCYPCKYSDWFDAVSEERTMIAEILKREGYHTYGFTSNPCTSTLHNYERGFDVFKDNIAFKSVSGPLLEFFLTLKTVFVNPYRSSESLNAQIFNSLKAKKVPYFLWVHYMDMHGPYISSRGWKFRNRIKAGKLWRKAPGSPEKITSEEKAGLKKVYKEKMAHLDRKMGELLRRLDDDHTMVIITGDHGDCFGEHGHYGHPAVFYNEMIKMPLFVKLPRELGIRNRRIKKNVALMDIVPTIVDYLDLKSDTGFDGTSLRPLIEGGDDYEEKVIISEISRVHGSVIRGKWKLIAHFFESSFELYDLQEDFEERRNLAHEKPGIVEELKNIFIEHIVKHKPPEEEDFFERLSFIKDSAIIKSTRSKSISRG